MSRSKHILDIAPSDDEDANGSVYNSEDDFAETKGRAVKRRKTASTHDYLGLQSDEDEDDHDHDHDNDEDKDKVDADSDKNNDKNANDTIPDTSAATSQPPKKKPAKPLSTKKPKKNKTGVIYFSSLPPYLKPSALKTLLESRGFEPVTKIFLSPLSRSDPRKNRSNNKRKMYTDGWAEFASKKTAKICAETLNATTIGQRGYYKDDIWNIKYLRGFKWADLIEQVNRERAERDAKRRLEDTRARKEEKVYLAGVEAGRVADRIARQREEKKSSARSKEGGDVDQVPEKTPQSTIRRTFVQNNVVRAHDKEQEAVGEDVKRVLGKIF